MDNEVLAERIAGLSEQVRLMRNDNAADHAQIIELIGKQNGRIRELERHAAVTDEKIKVSTRLLGALQVVGNGLATFLGMRF